MVASQLAIEVPVERAGLPHSIVGALLAFGLIGGTLLAVGGKNYPDLHTILDTCMSLLSGALALLLWDVGARIDRPFPRWIAIAFAATAVLEFLHVIVTVEWSGFLAPIAAARSFLRPATWPPAAHVLPVAVGGAIWLMRRGSTGVLGFALAITVLSAGLLAVFEWLPAYTAAGPLGFTRPTLILAPLLWAIIGLVCWKLRAADRLLKPLALTAVVLCLANTAMLYSRAPHDEVAMVAHLGRGIGYFVLLLSLMKMASLDIIERIRAEAKLARLNEDLERRVLERTGELQSANETLQSEIAVRRQAEQKAQAQLERLNLLHQITRAIGERQDLNSIFQVVVRCLEDQLPVDFACLCLYEQADHSLTVARVGVNSGALALELAMPERARVDIDENGLSQCVAGKLVYEPDIRHVDFPFPRRLASGAARTLLGLAGLTAFENKYPDSLSGGMKQRVGIVRALATGPKVLLLDEPFGALDAQTRVIMQQILTNMWQRLKISVLFVTHDIDEAIFLSDRVYCMTARPGTIKAEITIPLERPRHQSMMMSSEFLGLRRGLMSLIREESIKAMGGELNDLALDGLSIDLHGQSLADVL